MYEHLLIVNVDEGNGEKAVLAIGVDSEQLKVFFDFATHIYMNPENAFIKINGALIQHSKITDWTSFTKEEIMAELTRKVEK
ncbi:hypothetical protein HFX79_000347 [Enterococcus faecium]|uniref:hypothetical protein n=1 Tax=Enterococcus faecium TaxID=1352 RepID=UPI002E9B6058|nr:hypothetical protein [Enterococcus faecium]